MIVISLSAVTVEAVTQTQWVARASFTDSPRHLDFVYYKLKYWCRIIQNKHGHLYIS